MIDMEASEVERPWVLKESGFQTISLGLGHPQRGYGCAVRGSLSVCAATERHAVTLLMEAERKQEGGAQRGRKTSILLTKVDGIARSLGE